jgi:hypothetical protein
VLVICTRNRSSFPVQASGRYGQQGLASFLSEVTERIDRVQKELGSNIPMNTIPGPGSYTTSTGEWDPSRVLEDSPELEEHHEEFPSPGTQFQSWNENARVWAQPVLPPHALDSGLQLRSTSDLHQEASPSNQPGLVSGAATVKLPILPACVHMEADGSSRKDRHRVDAETSDDDHPEDEHQPFTAETEVGDSGMDMRHHEYTQDPWVVSES